MRGQSTSQAPKGNDWLPNVANLLSAAGTNQGSAYQIPQGQDLSIFTTVASGSGAILPSAGVSVSEEYATANHGANALLVYPPSGAKIGTLGTNSAYSVAAGKLAFFVYVGGGQWTSCP